MTKLKYIIGALVIATLATVAYAAPVIQYFTNVAPFTDNTFDNGTTTNAWKNIYTYGLRVSTTTIGCMQGGLTSAGTVTAYFTGTNCGSGSGNSFAFPFDVQAGYNSTSTVIGFNGLFSTASSTFSGPLYFSALSQGSLYIGTNGRVNTVATSTLTGTGLISVTAGAYTLGATPIVVSCSTCGAGTITAVTGSYPIVSSGGNTPNITFLGLGTTSPWTTGQLSYVVNGNTVTSVATTSVTCTGSTTCTAFTAIGGAPITINSTGSTFTGSPNTIVTTDASGALMSTSSQLTVGNLIATTTATSYFLGKVGIGTINPTLVNANALLTVAGSSSADVIASSTDNTTLSDAIMRVYAPGSSVFMGAHGTSQITSQYGIVVGGYAEIGAVDSSFGTSNGLLIGTRTTAKPIIFGSGSTERMRIDSNGNLAVGTSTPFAQYQTTISSSTNPQLSLSAGLGVPQITLRNAGGNFYLSTTTVAGNATTSTAMFAVNGSSGTTTVRGLDIQANATTTSNIGYSISSGCYAIGTTCLSSGTGLTAYDAWTHSNQYPFNSATTSKIAIGTTTPYYSFTVSSSTGPQIALSDGTANGGISLWTFRNAGGSLFFATTTTAGNATSSVSAFQINTNGQLVNPYLSTAGTVNNLASGALYTTATSTPTATAPITYSGTFGSFIGGVGGAFDCTSASAGVKGCITAADYSILKTATTTFSSPLVYTLSTNAVTCTACAADSWTHSTQYPFNSATTSTISIGTTTPYYSLTVASSTGPQFALSAGVAGVSSWYFRNAGGAMYIGTTTIAGTATSSIPALTWTNAGMEGLGTSTPWGALSINPTLLGSGVPEFVIGSTSATHLVVDGGGNVGVNDSTPDFRLESVGSFANGFFGLTRTTDGDIFNCLGTGTCNVGTTTNSSGANLAISSSTAPQLALSVGAGIAQWVVRAESDNSLSWATTTVAGTATTSTDALNISGAIGSYGIAAGTTTPSASFAFNTVAGTDAMAIGSSTGTMFRLDKSGHAFFPQISKATAGTNQTTCYTSATGELVDETTTACAVSSMKFKHNIVSLNTNGLNTIMSLRPVVYSYNTDVPYDYQNRDYGFIAEEVAAVDPHLAEYGTDGLPRNLDDRAILANVVKAIQEMNGKVVGNFSTHWLWWAFGFLALWNVLITGYLIKRKWNHT